MNGRSMSLALVEGDRETVDQFADELAAGDPGFDRVGFITAATEPPS